MDSIRFLPMNFRVEAAAALSRLAYRGDDEHSGGVREAAECYSRKYAIPMETFSGIIEAYEYVKKHLSYDESELLALFSDLGGMGSSLYEIFLTMETAIGVERCKDLGLRIAFMVAYDNMEPDFSRNTPGDLFAAVSQMAITDEAKWLYVDACMRYELYRTRIDKLLGRTEQLIRKKSALLEPYAEAAVRTFERYRHEGKLFEHFAEHGIRLDCENATVTPNLINFSFIILNTNAIAAAKYGEIECSDILFGVLIDLIREHGKTSRDATEATLTLLHALDDKRRLQILSALKTRPRYGQELVAVTGLSAATISHHMNELAGAGLVSIEKQGVKLLYHIKEKRIRELTELLQQSYLN
jgi:DNA-binding transcriptional ArsR family regulator